jgi:cysteine desulfurase family protein (TIGR01976 family)
MTDATTRSEPGVHLDIDAVRGHFPALRDGTAFFDGPGGTQTPEVVGDAISRTITAPLANQGDVTTAERNAEAAVNACRAAAGDLLGVDPGTIVFGRSMTQLTMDMARTLAKNWGPGDEVVVTRLDHDANVRTWVIAAQAVGATIRWAEFDPATGELAPEKVAEVVNAQTRLVAVTAASNLIGTMPDLPAIAEIAHASGALFYVDGVHYTAHCPVDVSALGADFYVCSPYKFLGPHCGVLHGRSDLLETLRPDKLLPSADTVPERFELGTLPYELMAGTTAAIDFLAALAGDQIDGDRRQRLLAAFEAIDAHELKLRQRIEDGLRQLPGVTLHSRAQRRTPTLLVTFDRHDPQDVRRRLAQRGVNAPASSFYAYEPARVLGLGEAGGVRVGLAPYNNDADVDALLEGLSDIIGG